MSSPIYLSNYSIAKLQDLAFGATAFTPPVTLYWERFTTVPLADGTGGVVATYTGYAGRVAFTNNTTNWANSSSQEKHNLKSITWPTNTGGSEVHAGWGIYDASTSGNLIAVGKYSTGITIAGGQEPFVAAGDFSYTLKNSLTTPANGGCFPSNFLIAALLDHLFGATAYTPAATHYLARYTASPTAVSGSGTEAAYTAYARKSFTNNTTSWANSTSQTKKNAIDLIPTAAGSGPTSITDWAIYDALTTGNELLVMHSINTLILLSGGTDDVPANTLNWKISNS